MEFSIISSVPLPISLTRPSTHAAMAASSRLMLTQALLLLLAMASADMTLTVVNNCAFTIWPAIQPNSGNDLLEGGGFQLTSLTYRSFPAPAQPWSGRIWGRTGCIAGPGAPFSCDTGDCGGRLQCGGLGGAVPATLAQISLHQGGSLDKSSYSVSLVDGFNLPVTVTPHEGQGVCPVVGCRADLLPSCPAPLLLRAAGGSVVGCKSGCAAFGTDELCCRNGYNSPATCRPSSYSEYFKQACPATYTYPQDTPSLTPNCAAPKELKVIFCQ
uniref:Osmotin-like protein n=1 Tax=Anthurium amnicola TaxID=1678845 RepID=A0A1D1YFI6_9ARAE